MVRMPIQKPPKTRWEKNLWKERGKEIISSQKTKQDGKTGYQLQHHQMIRIQVIY